MFSKKLYVNYLNLSSLFAYKNFHQMFMIIFWPDLCFTRFQDWERFWCVYFRRKGPDSSTVPNTATAYNAKDHGNAPRRFVRDCEILCLFLGKSDNFSANASILIMSEDLDESLPLQDLESIRSRSEEDLETSMHNLSLNDEDNGKC